MLSAWRRIGTSTQSRAASSVGSSRSGWKRTRRNPKLWKRYPWWIKKMTRLNPLYHFSAIVLYSHRKNVRNDAVLDRAEGTVLVFVPGFYFEDGATSCCHLFKKFEQKIHLSASAEFKSLCSMRPNLNISLYLISRVNKSTFWNLQYSRFIYSGQQYVCLQSQFKLWCDLKLRMSNNQNI